MELRWVERYVPMLGREDTAHAVMVLQYRVLTGPAFNQIWSEWYDVPTVKGETA